MLHKLQSLSMMRSPSKQNDAALLTTLEIIQYMYGFLVMKSGIRCRMMHVWRPNACTHHRKGNHSWKIHMAPDLSNSYRMQSLFLRMRNALNPCTCAEKHTDTHTTDKKHRHTHNINCLLIERNAIFCTQLFL